MRPVRPQRRRDMDAGGAAGVQQRGAGGAPRAEQHERGGVERVQAERGRARGAACGAVVGGGNWEGQIHIATCSRRGSGGEGVEAQIQELGGCWKGGRTGGENKTCRFSEAISIDVAVASIFRQRTGILRGSTFFFCSSTFLLFSLGLWRGRWRPDLGNFQRGKRSMLGGFGARKLGGVRK
ncbi:hypothetical protein GQ55_7G162100 [Panicum hallii var. hallii]|uniref:Uncharacterized protein n=1 Tax=Panicum hallii var. hallii TaxID=1504633 RepID=A0A2T7CVP4_9POAL|nr:hypothetical protein GQ55_7G162100 [Panicum hallii var. hallii]